MEPASKVKAETKTKAERTKPSKKRERGASKKSTKEESVLKKRTRKESKLAKCDFLDFEAEESDGREERASRRRSVKFDELASKRGKPAVLSSFVHSGLPSSN